MKNYTPLCDLELCFMDTETTGLSASMNEVIEVAIVRCHPQTFDIIFEWSTKIAPQRIEVNDPKALECNGYDKHPELWDGAPIFDEIADELMERIKGGIAVGHNIAFDLRFLECGLRRAGRPTRLVYHQLDTLTLVYEHLVPLGLTSMSLDSVRKFLGMSDEGAHTALQDSRDVREVYKRLVTGDYL